jgi:alpha-beta hydrolase superfamily lysophospholipase
MCTGLKRWVGWTGLLCLLAGQVFADTVSLEVRPGIRASAVYLKAGPAKGAVLILHGFLQTREFPTVSNLGESLHDADYSVLMPTLSLGIDLRRRSLPCEAIHLHRLDQDVDELAQWVDWLARRQHGPIVLVGHSAGGHVITRYLATHPGAPVKRVVLVSLGYPVGRVPHRKGGGTRTLGDYSLGFCLRYPTTSVAYHSYVDWSTDKMLDTMQHARMPVDVIIGSSDKRIRPEWVDRMRKGGVKVHIVKGANHFFDSAQEFDLDDLVESLLDDAGDGEAGT